MITTLTILLSISFVLVWCLWLIEMKRRIFWYREYIYFKDLAKKSLDGLHIVNQKLDETLKQRNFFMKQLAKTDFPFHLHSNYE